MRFGAHLAGAGPFASRDRIMRLARRSEELGMDSVWLSDHVVMPVGFRSTYPYGPASAFTVESARVYYEPLITLAWVASATHRVQLGISVLVLPVRNPVLTAKQLATLDDLSEGRLILGVGVGWLEEEFRALGASFQHRGPMTDEYARIFRSLWTGEPASFKGDFYQFDQLQSLPRPAQPGGIPMWVGGHSARALRRTIEIGDAWHAIKISAEDFGAAAGRLRQLAAERGRPTPILTTLCEFGDGSPYSDTEDWSLVGHAEVIAAKLRKYLDAGCQEIVLGLHPRNSTDGMLEALERFTTEIRPALDATSANVSF